jgi:hypothetical protein
VGPAGQHLGGDRLGRGRADLLQVPAVDPGHDRLEAARSASRSQTIPRSSSSRRPTTTSIR